MRTKHIIAACAAAALLTSCGSSGTSSSQAESSSETTAVTTASAASTTTASETTATTTANAEPDVTTELPEESLPDEETPITPELFEDALDNVSVEIDGDRIIQTGNVNDQDYSLTIDLSKWEHFTTPNDMVQLSRLFWQSYPKMYERFSDITHAPSDIILAIEDDGYAVAEAGGDLVHIHDEWIYNNPEDYDCFTHELGHIAQDGLSWDDYFLEYSRYTELFADLIRMEYPLDNGYYNDSVWTMQTAYEQDSRETSVRFLVWLDYLYSTKDNDLIRKFCEICYDQRYTAEQWDYAWEEIFAGTELEGMTADEAWEIFLGTDFSYLTTDAEKGEVSDLLKEYDIRDKANEIISHATE